MDWKALMNLSKTLSMYIGKIYNNNNDNNFLGYENKDIKWKFIEFSKIQGKLNINQLEWLNNNETSILIWENNKFIWKNIDDILKWNNFDINLNWDYGIYNIQNKINSWIWLKMTWINKYFEIKWDFTNWNENLIIENSNFQYIKLENQNVLINKWLDVFNNDNIFNIGNNYSKIINIGWTIKDFWRIINIGWFNDIINISGNHVINGTLNLFNNWLINI